MGKIYIFYIFRAVTIENEGYYVYRHFPASFIQKRQIRWRPIDSFDDEFVQKRDLNNKFVPRGANSFSLELTFIMKGCNNEHDSVNYPQSVPIYLKP